MLRTQLTVKIKSSSKNKLGLSFGQERKSKKNGGELSATDVASAGRKSATLQATSRTKMQNTVSTAARSNAFKAKTSYILTNTNTRFRNSVESSISNEPELVPT